ncbi:MAG: hypothetical protein ACRCZF_25975 [Gemmataceae bacterium]
MSAGRSIQTWRASVPKNGLTAAQNEDAVGVAGAHAAVADGASEGWQSGLWARALVEAFCAGPPMPDTFAAWLVRAQSHYQEQDAAPAATATAWYAEEKQQQGAFSTFVGFSLLPSKDGGWRYRAVAVGDSCLFQVRGGNFLTRWPVESIADFGNRPILVGTNGPAAEPLWFAGRAQVGDRFYLMTDALAEWCYRTADAANLLSQLSVANFPAWVAERRQDQTMKNDDTTLLVRTIVPGDAA